MPDTEYHRRQFEVGYAWFKAMKRACSTVSLINSDAELCEALLKIASQAESANAALRSLESLSENELKVLPDRNLVEKIQLVTCLLTPRDKTEAQSVIENSCGQEAVTLRIKHSLRSLLGTSSDILLLTRVALHDSSSRARMVRTFQTRTKNLTEPANVKWIRLGQLMVAVHLLNEAERPPNSQTTFAIRRSANFLLDALP